jgi:hypothetical protein
VTLGIRVHRRERLDRPRCCAAVIAVLAQLTGITQSPCVHVAVFYQSNENSRNQNVDVRKYEGGSRERQPYSRL